MNLLLVAATHAEVAPTLSYLRQHFSSPEGQLVFENSNLHITLLITGVGSIATAWHLAGQIATQPVDWALNAGICGALDPALNLGDVVHVVTERFGDVGTEEADGSFTDVFELGLLPYNEQPFVNGMLFNPEANQARFLPGVQGLTVNRVHGYEMSIQSLRRKYPGAQVESMEGAAFFYGCLSADIPFAEIRGISNYVEPRNRDNWKIELAVTSLNEVLIEMIKSLLT